MTLSRNGVFPAHATQFSRNFDVVFGALKVESIAKNLERVRRTSRNVIEGARETVYRADGSKIFTYHTNVLDVFASGVRAMSTALILPFSRTAFSKANMSRYAGKRNDAKIKRPGRGTIKEPPAERRNGAHIYIYTY